ncbi:hypothetical protein CANCADRAFT_95540 [Tortispora caseinolytica NRRL Y-17796]|uniref:Fork-head domain-containing protein n=1 Tax=Tortispora caseinolytica NRRL Y-17796 TaxID=767744 RepID=A0A1E4TMJ0_9ASCO|nr:hypothetical protein CANCADRAFT_95540 [Tortispora caseinolytica NRRL Y-17796]
MSSTKGSVAHYDTDNADSYPESRKRTHSELKKLQDPLEEINRKISSLPLPRQTIQVAIDHANSDSYQGDIRAYGKIAGPNWTYYIKEVELLIGRNYTGPDNTPEDNVQIDLGPSKVVSRKHAAIIYDYQSKNWFLHVLGRNGLKIDGIHYKSGAVFLRSGSHIEISDIHMIFALPSTLVSSDGSMAVNSSPTKYYSPSKPLPTGNFINVSNSPNFYANRSSNDRGPSEQSNLTYPKGVAIISKAQVKGINSMQQINEIDFSRDDAKDIKPPYSYATMITQAILSSPEGSLTLQGIYDWISSNYSFYRFSRTGWQNSVRHNLSLSKAFAKVPRRSDEPGKGMKWTILPDHKEEFLRRMREGDLTKRRSAYSVGSSKGVNGTERDLTGSAPAWNVYTPGPQLVVQHNNTSIPFTNGGAMGSFQQNYSPIDSLTAAASAAAAVDAPQGPAMAPSSTRAEEQELLTPTKPASTGQHNYPKYQSKSYPSSPTRDYSTASNVRATTPNGSMSTQHVKVEQSISQDGYQKETNYSSQNIQELIGASDTNTEEPRSGDFGGANASLTMPPTLGVTETPMNFSRGVFQLAPPSAGQQQQLPSSYMQNSSPSSSNTVSRFFPLNNTPYRSLGFHGAGTPARDGSTSGMFTFSNGTGNVSLGSVSALQSNAEIGGPGGFYDFSPAKFSSPMAISSERDSKTKRMRNDERAQTKSASPESPLKQENVEPKLEKSSAAAGSANEPDLLDADNVPSSPNK